MPSVIQLAPPASEPQNAGGTGKNPAPKRLRVLVVLNSICLYGLERSVIEIFASLRQSIDPYVLIPRATSRYQTALLSEIRHSDLPHCYFSDYTDWPRIGKPRSLRVAWRIIWSVVRGNLDVLRSAKECDWLYIPIVSGLYLSFAAILWFRLTGRKVIYTFHDLTLNRSLRLWLASRFVSDFIHSSEYGLQAVKKGNPWISKKSNHIIPPTVVVRGRAGGMDPVLAAGRSLLYMGQVAKHKGIDVLLEAFRQIAAEFPDARLDIVGSAGWQDGGDFAKSIQDPAFAGRVKHWGYVGDIEPFLRFSYAYIQPTLPSICHESFGRGAAEAMWAGVPVVCFRSGALAEIVEHEITGLICKTESAECLAAALRRLLSSPEERERYGRQGRLRFGEKYSVRRINEQWGRLIRGLADPGCSG